MFFSIYVSTARTWWTPRELQALLASSRAHNLQAGITGMLLYKEGNFMQVLEGEEEVVRALQRRITSDRRHEGVVTIAAGQQTQRQFDGWSMGFADLGDRDAPPPPGYSRFLDTPLTDPLFLHDPGPGRQLLQLFRAID